MYVRHLVERQFAVDGGGIAGNLDRDLPRAVVPSELLHPFVPRMTVQVFWEPPVRRDRQAGKRQPWKQTVTECLVHVANGIQLVTNRASIDASLVGFQRRCRRI